jgi:thioredoxin reductase (NADPH)
VSLVVPLVLGGLAVLLMAVFTMLSARKRRLQTVAPAVLVGPQILVHDINDDRCTGCDACVAVCPTNVLDLVANKSRVLRFGDCIQCEACMFACPTEALVMFPEGSTPPPLKVPELDDHFMTAVPGQYLIGEVAGKPLVKNAANLGRGVIEHMRATGLRAGALGAGGVDVAIVGSGPGGLSAALTCVQRGLSYVLLEKEQLIASTIARYPKGKLVMAEPYGTANVSLLPVFDASKEQLIPIWHEVLQRTGVGVRLGESVEAITRGADGAFELRTTVSSYRAQRVVLSIGTRGKPRTLQVPGENLPKVFGLLEDPDAWRGSYVLVVGGGDSACEAALALADAGAKVLLSHRGKGFARAAPRNKDSIEQYVAQNRIRTLLGSQVIGIDADAVMIALADGTQQRFPNQAAFVLIGSDPPIAWLSQMGIQFVERPHQYALGPTDELVRRYVQPIDCPEDAASAAALVLGQPMPEVQPPILPVPTPLAPSGPRKWLQSATSIFSSAQHKLKTDPRAKARARTQPPPLPGIARAPRPPAPVDNLPTPFTGAPSMPTPLTGIQTPLIGASKESRPSFAQSGTIVRHAHSGHGRRDELSGPERTRILRMLRDDGGGEEESGLYRVGNIHMLPSAGERPRPVDGRGQRLHELTPLPGPLPVAPVRPTPPARQTFTAAAVADIDESSEQVHIGAMPDLSAPPRSTTRPPIDAMPPSAQPAASPPPRTRPPSVARRATSSAVAPEPSAEPPPTAPPRRPRPPSIVRRAATPATGAPPPPVELDATTTRTPPKFIDSSTTIDPSPRGAGDRWPDRAPGTDPHVPDFDTTDEDV